jgi:hypothetical protein
VALALEDHLALGPAQLEAGAPRLLPAAAVWVEGVERIAGDETGAPIVSGRAVLMCGW